MDLQDIIRQLRSCVISSKELLSLRQLNHDYKFLMGEHIPFQKMRFRSLEDLIQSAPDLNLIKRGNELYVTADTSEKSAHITEMVAKQKTAKRRPLAPRYNRANLSPRMQQTSPWRPKSYLQPNKYQSSSRPQAVSHSQFVNRSSTPSVLSKVVIPEYSTLNTKRSQNMPLRQNVPAPAAHRSEMNQRLTSNRIRENINALLHNNNIQNENKKPVNIGNILPSRTKPTNGTIDVFDKPNNLQIGASDNSTDTFLSTRKKSTIDVLDKPNNLQIGASDSSTDPLLSTRIRLSKKISELSLERDSGNSSPTNEVLPPVRSKSPEFVRTKDPLADLKSFSEMHKLGEVNVDIADVKIKRNRFYSCKVMVGQKYTYTSYPKECLNPLEAQAFCCEQALDDLIPKFKTKSLLISTEMDILDRIPPMLEKHNHGIWAWQLKLDYSDKYNEHLSDDWLKVIDSSPRVQIEKVSEDHILYHCRPGDKGQQRGAGGAVPLSKVSIPANTVQFGADNRLFGQVTCAMSANEIWCEQIETEESDEFAQMSSRLQVFYQEHESELLPVTILPESYYVAKYDEVYYRVRAVTVSDEDVDCFFIDCGDEISIPKTNIFDLQRVYATIQAQAFVCRLSGLEDLYGMSANSQALSSLCDKPVILELATDLNNGSPIDVLPVFMYDMETGKSLNEELINKLTMELATPCLQPEGITEVYVSNVESNGDIYVQVRTKGFENLQLLRRKLEERVTERPPTEILYRVTQSNSREKLYFMKHVDIKWHRVKLIDWSPDGIHAQVYFIDEGYAVVIEVAKETLYPLETLNDVFNNYPYQATKVRMFLDKVPDDFVDLASTAMPKDTSVLLKIIRLDKDVVPLVKLFRRNADGGLFCINESVALQAELSAKKKNEPRNNYMLSRINGSDHVPSTGLLKCPSLPKIEGDIDCFQVLIPVAVSPSNFFIQPSNSSEQLNYMMEMLQKRYEGVEHGSLKVDDIMPGSIYASKHTDGFWYRVSVIKVISSGSSVSVFYSDFGYYQTLPVNQLLPLDEEFMMLPYQALKAKLAEIKPKQNKWSMEDCNTFKELVEKKHLFAKVVNTENDVLYESDLVFNVILIDTNTEEDIFISQELVKRGIAVAQ